MSRPDAAAETAPLGPSAVELSRLALPPEDAARLAAACERTAARWHALPESAPGDGAPRHPAGLHDVLREDTPVAGLTSDDALAAAPDRAEGAFVVPRVADVA